ncbi:MAG: metalloregulator ArsR/SmtB family transcription factor [bacterium]|nr:metalloregulator ArsR/SmtB family transcription factor [bacterium]
MDEDDAIFKALADSSRRKLLDVLRQKDGQTLGALCEHLEMTRFGVMKHLQLLEDCGLVITQKKGREKYHFLNPIPIQQVYDRWVSQYSQHWSQKLTTLKFSLEENVMSERITHVMQIFIRTTPQTLWDALTKGDMTRQYYFETRVESDWQAGSPYHYLKDDGSVMIKGEVVESIPPQKLVTTFYPVWREDQGSIHKMLVTFEIEPVDTMCKLTLTHSELEAEAWGIKEGWARILSGLKTLLETGKPLEEAKEAV